MDTPEDHHERISRHAAFGTSRPAGGCAQRHANPDGANAAKPGPKSIGKAIALSVFFGPLGVIYATFGTREDRWAFAWLVGSVMLMFAVGLRLAAVIAVSVIWSVLAVRSHNRQFNKL